MTFLVPAASAAEPGPSIRLGIIDSLFDGEVDRRLFTAIWPLAANSTYKRVGRKAQATIVKDAEALAEDLAAGRMNIGIMAGVHYGWIRPRFPECKPLIALVNQTMSPKVLFLVAKTNPAMSAADLKGQTLARPRRLLFYHRLFLERSAPEEFFRKLEVDNMSTAIDAVIEDKAQVTVVDDAAWEAYRERKPGRAARLRVLSESPPFPPTVVVYHAGGDIEQKELDRYRRLMLIADKSVEDRQSLTLFKMKAFEDVPENFDKLVEEIVKAYPPAKKE